MVREIGTLERYLAFSPSGPLRDKPMRKQERRLKSVVTALVPEWMLRPLSAM